MKNVVIIVAGTGRHHDLSIEPGTTSRDILAEIGLAGYRLSKDNGQHVFGDNENVYPLVEDGEKIHCSSKTDVGSVQASVLMSRGLVYESL